MLTIFNHNDFVLNEISFTHPERNVGNSYIAKTNYPNKQRYIIQLPLLKTLDGIITIDKKEYLTLEIDEQNIDVSHFFSNIDEYCIKYISDHSNEWFEEEYDISSIENTYKNTIKKIGNSYVIRIRIPPSMKDVISVFDENKNKVGFDHIVQDSELITLIELEGLRFLRTQVIPIWNLLQCKVYQPDTSLQLTDYLIIDNHETNIYTGDEEFREDEFSEDEIINEVEKNADEENNIKLEQVNNDTSSHLLDIDAENKNMPEIQQNINQDVGDNEPPKTVEENNEFDKQIHHLNEQDDCVSIHNNNEIDEDFSNLIEVL